MVASAPQPFLAHLNRTRNYLGYTNWRSDANGDPPSDADFDEIKIFNRYLTAREIQGDMAMTSAYVIKI